MVSFPIVRMPCIGWMWGECLISTASVADWDALYAVNVRGTFLCYKYAADAMIKQGRGGRIVGEQHPSYTCTLDVS